MDATQADIYLVSRHDRSKVIGRPYIHLAVDTATQLIAGVYVGLECDESAVMLCLANAAQCKVDFCRKYGIEIDSTQWPSQGLPHEIITDKGTEFFGSRMQEERKLRSGARKQEVAASVTSIQSIRQIVKSATATGSEKHKQDGTTISENRSSERGLLTT